MITIIISSSIIIIRIIIIIMIIVIISLRSLALAGTRYVERHVSVDRDVRVLEVAVFFVMLLCVVYVLLCVVM